MTEPFFGEIRYFGFNFAPRGWALCNGQAIPIRQNAALFGIIGNTYGGDSNNFKLPNLQGNAACSTGTGSGGGSNYIVGQTFGTKTVTLNVGQLPAHAHTFKTVTSATLDKVSNAPAAGSYLGRTFNQNDFKHIVNNAPQPDTKLSPLMIGSLGNGQPHVNQQPYLVINFCIALVGTFPSRQ